MILTHHVECPNCHSRDVYDHNEIEYVCDNCGYLWNHFVKQEIEI